MHIFRAGTRQDANGQTVTITEADLVASANAYNPELHEAPLVVGHPTTDAPAYGWVQNLQAKGSELEAVPQQLDPVFAESVKAGRYKKISASFYTPEAVNNPVPGVWYLRHVGFLGATPPAVKGLKPVNFGEQEEGVVEFSEWMDPAQVSVFRNLREFLIDQFGMDTADKVVPLFLVDEMQLEARSPAPEPMFSDPPQPPLARGVPQAGGSAHDTNGVDMTEQTKDFAERENQITAKEAELKAREIAIAREEHVNFAEGLVKKGQLLPAQKNKAVELLSALSVSPETVSFGEGENKFEGSIKDLFKQFLEQQPKVVNYSEFAPSGTTPTAWKDDPQVLARKITEHRNAELAKGRTISFAEAQAEVLAG